MPEQLLKIADESGNDNRNLRNTLGELYPGNTGDVLTRNAAGEYEAKAPTSSGGGTGTAKKTFIEKLVITSDDVLPALTFTPSDVQNFWLRLNGVEHTPKGGAFLVSAPAKSITLLGTGGYGVKAGWYVEVEYYTDDTITTADITSFTPTSATVGQQVVITGAGFVNVTSVVIGGITQSVFTVDSPTQITVTLGIGAYSGGNVVVSTNALGTATKSGFTFIPPLPTITSFAPTTQVGSGTVVITGTNFYNVSAVSFGGTAATSFVVNSPTQITAVVGATGASGSVSVTTMYGTATKAGFTWQPVAPTITSFTPALATAGTVVTINGFNFNGALSVYMNGFTVSSFIVDSATQIRATIGSANTSGQINVTTPLGIGTSAASLDIDQILPFPRTGRGMSAATSVINTRSYTAVAQNQSAGNEAWRAFNNSADWWLSSTVAPIWVEIQLPLACVVGTYSLTMPNVDPNNFPKSWDFQGWDGTAWVTLDSRTNISLIAGANNFTVPIPNRGQYQRHRINITQGGSAFFLQVISELTLFPAF